MWAVFLCAYNIPCHWALWYGKRPRSFVLAWVQQISIFGSSDRRLLVDMAMRVSGHKYVSEIATEVAYN